MGLLGPCEWPVLGYGENHGGNLDDASIKATRVQVSGEQKKGEGEVRKLFVEGFFA